jgi:hypothetical protein
MSNRGFPLLAYGWHTQFQLLILCLSCNSVSLSVIFRLSRGYMARDGAFGAVQKSTAASKKGAGILRAAIEIDVAVCGAG